MPRNVQRLGAGPSGVGANSCRASSPGACCNRSINSARRSKTHPMLAALLKPPNTADTQAFIPIQPIVDGIRVTWLQQAVARDRVRRVAIGNFQQGGTALPHVGTCIVIAIVLQILPL